jgi:hypothetical protein
MKYTQEIINKITAQYVADPGLHTVALIAKELNVSDRSVIAKLSSLGCYKKKEYLNIRGELPIKKEEYIERIGVLLDINVDLLESLEKVTKTALMLIAARVEELK